MKGLPAAGSERLVDLVAAYLADVRRRGLSEATLTAYRNPLDALVRFLARRHVQLLEHVRESHITAWALRVKSGRSETRTGPGNPLRPCTIHGYLSIVRRFFAWLVDAGVILASPAQGLDVRDVPQDPVSRLIVPTEAQLRSFLNEAPRETPLELRDLAVFELAYATGLRIGELRALDLGDVDLDQGLVRVRQGKGRKDRVVPIGRPASEAVVWWLDAGRPQLARDRALQALFVTVQGRRLGRDTMTQRLEKLRRCGLPRFRVHDLRHASALHMLRHGADLRHIQVLLGHATVGPTHIYTRLEPADLKAAHRKAHPRERCKDRS